MFGRNNLSLAIKMLTDNHKVIPEKYTMYNGGFLFLAYPPGIKNKDQVLSPYYLVDLKTKKVGPFSPAFDFEGFFNAIDKMKKI